MGKFLEQRQQKRVECLFLPFGIGQRFTKKRNCCKQAILQDCVLFEKGGDFSIKTTVHIHRLFEKFGFDEIFGRNVVMELLELKAS